MDYNINVKYKPGGATGGALGISGIARQKAIQAGKTGGTLRPDDSASAKKLIDTNIKLTTSILKLNQSITLLTGTIKSRGGLGGGPGVNGGTPMVGGTSGIGSIGAAAGYIGIPLAIAGFAIQKINQIGSAYIDKVSQQKGTVGVGGFHTGRKGSYLSPEVGAAYKAYRMASGSFKGDVDPMAFKMGTIFGLSPDEVGREAGIMKRYGNNYGDIAAIGAGSGIQTDLPRFMSGIAAELEEAVKNGVNNSSISSDIADEMASLTNKTQTKSVEMAFNIVNKGKGYQSSAAKGQIGDINSLMTWKAGQSRVMDGLNSLDRGTMINQWKTKGIIDDKEAEMLMRGDQKNGGMINESFIRNTLGQGGLSAITRDTISNMSGAESVRRSMLEVQKRWGTGAKAFRQWNAINSQTGGAYEQNDLLAIWNNAYDFDSSDKKTRGNKILNNKYDDTDNSAPLLGVKKQQMFDDLLYKHGAAFADASLKMERELINMVDTIAEKVIPAFKEIANYSSGKKSIKKIGKVTDDYDLDSGFRRKGD